MYVPPYVSLLRSLDTDKTAIENASKVRIPVELLKLLLQIAIANGEFDEDQYLRANLDVNEAVKRGDVESGRLHYIGFGYFEGRRGAVAFDSAWYLENYPDVAQAVSKGLTGSAEEHFYVGGGGEGRSPSATEKSSADEWKRALR